MDLMRTGLGVAFGLVVAVVTACTPPVNPAGDPLKTPSTKDAFEGTQCDAVRPQTEPDLMGWDPGSRAKLDRLRRSGVVAVRYEAKGCNVEMELLASCIGPTAKYAFSPYSANERKVAHNAAELFAALPLGAARLSGQVKGNRSLRTDYMLAGQYALPPDATYKRDDLRGTDCARATHVISAVYVGAFAMVAGDQRSVEGSATVFGARAGGKSAADVEVIGDEGDADACKASQKDAKESDRCAVPLRVGLLALDQPRAPDPPPPAPPPKASAAVAPMPAATSGRFEPSLIVGKWAMKGGDFVTIERVDAVARDSFKYVTIHIDACKDAGTIQRTGSTFTFTQTATCPNARTTLDKWQITGVSETSLVVTSPESGATRTYELSH
jgi:hypothetical protein